jgi:AcrR family transcriptional regulator
MVSISAHHGARQRQKFETRDRVLTAARKLFEAKGYADVTVRMIADDAEVAVGSVFTCFESKDDLLVEIIAADFLEIGPAVEAKLSTDVAAPLIDRIMDALQPAIEYDLSHASKLRESLAHSWTRTFDQEQRVRAALAPIMKSLRREIARAQKLGEVSAEADAGLLAQMLIQSYYGCYRQVIFDGLDHAGLNRTVRAQIAVILR